MASKISVKHLLILFVTSCYYFTSSSHSDTISQGQELRDWQHLDSANKLFRLQFLSPGTTQSRYLGIIMQPISNRDTYDDTVWIANRNNPIPDASGKLMIDIDGKFKISYGGTNTIVMNSVPALSNASATLLDNGNLVLREFNFDGSVNRTVWQSFDYPTATLLPGMKLGINFRTGHRWSLTSWISREVPGSGSFTMGGDPNGTSQLIIWWQGDVFWTSGLWRNGTFDNALPLTFSPQDVTFSYVTSEDEKYLVITTDEKFKQLKHRISPYGFIELGVGAVGVISACGWKPDAGCVKEILPNCRKSKFWFERRNGYIFGDSYRFDDNYNLSKYDCYTRCMANCSCVAYASITDNGTGCEIWDSGMSFFPASEQSHPRFVNFLVTEKKIWKWITMSVGGVIFISFLGCLCFRRWKIKSRVYKAKQMILSELGLGARVSKSSSNKSDHELQLFSFGSITASTDNFSVANKLGEGGFGPVYKGKLPGGQLLAIKRLSSDSRQGITEFKNEVLLIAKLQHNNLVRLLGCCIEGDEKLLIYEYMPNKSLDFFLFNHSRETLLEWDKRLNIIEGIAQGLLYLHKYSRLRIIHRDLKASNILLDNDWNPKISDFGLARIFEQHESEAKTNRVVGTYGYMPPEYMAGTFSMKSDVFSFGVLLLEIVSGKKNHSTYHLERPLNLIGLAWELWNQGRALELMDPKIAESYQSDQVLRCIQVGLLCVQENPSDRPTMSDVVSMITHGASPNSIPNQPAFYIGRSSNESSSNGTAKFCSLNNITISDTQAR